MTTNQRGFTLVEIAFVLLIGTLLTSMAIRGFGNTTTRMSVNQARDAYNGLHSRARSIAIERGSVARISIDEAGDSVWVTLDGNRVEHQDFQDLMGVDIRSQPSGVVRICMTPRGFADPDCNNFSTQARLEFHQGGLSSELEILPLGQVRW